MYIYIYIYMYIYIYIYICIHTHYILFYFISLYSIICMYKYIYIFMYVYIYIYIYTHAHIYIYIYIYIYTCIFSMEIGSGESQQPSWMWQSLVIVPPVRILEPEVLPRSLLRQRCIYIIIYLSLYISLSLFIHIYIYIYIYRTTIILIDHNSSSIISSCSESTLMTGLPDPQDLARARGTLPQRTTLYIRASFGPSSATPAPLVGPRQESKRATHTDYICIHLSIYLSISLSLSLYIYIYIHDMRRRPPRWSSPTTPRLRGLSLGISICI